MANSKIYCRPVQTSRFQTLPDYTRIFWFFDLHLKNLSGIKIFLDFITHINVESKYAVIFHLAAVPERWHQKMQCQFIGQQITAKNQFSLSGSGNTFDHTIKMPEPSALTMANFIQIRVGAIFDYFIIFFLTIHHGILNNFDDIRKHTLSCPGASWSICRAWQWSPSLRSQRTLIFCYAHP